MKKVEGYTMDGRFFETEEAARIYEQKSLLKRILQPSCDLKVKLERTAGFELYGIPLTELLQKFVDHRVDFLRAVALVRELDELDQRIGQHGRECILYGLIYCHNFVGLEPLFKDDLSPLLNELKKRR